LLPLFQDFFMSDRSVKIAQTIATEINARLCAADDDGLPSRDTKQA